MIAVLVQHHAVIYDSNGETVKVFPHEEEPGLFVIEHSDGDTPSTRIVVFGETALALSGVLTNVVSINARANP